MANNERVGSDIDRRTLMKGAAAAGGAIGVGGVIVAATGAQENDDNTVTAEFCDQFSPGPQVQQCLSCIEDECEPEEVFPLFPLFTGLEGQCFTPAEIPSGADYVTLKAGQNCYIAPVDGYTTFCVPDGEPDISNATFYRCGGEPTPRIVEKTVTCDAITVTTANIEDGTTLSATVTYEDAEGEQSTETHEATVEDDQATFTLLGNLNPVHVQIFLGDQLLDDQEPEVDGAPCFDPDPTDPKEPKTPKEARKKMEKYKKKLEKCDEDCEEYERKYEKYKKMYEEMK